MGVDLTGAYPHTGHPRLLAPVRLATAESRLWPTTRMGSACGGNAVGSASESQCVIHGDVNPEYLTPVSLAICSSQVARSVLTNLFR